MPPRHCRGEREHHTGHTLLRAHPRPPLCQDGPHAITAPRLMGGLLCLFLSSSRSCFFTLLRDPNVFVTAVLTSLPAIPSSVPFLGLFLLIDFSVVMGHIFLFLNFWLEDCLEFYIFGSRILLYSFTYYRRALFWTKSVCSFSGLLLPVGPEPAFLQGRPGLPSCSHRAHLSALTLIGENVNGSQICVTCPC